MTTFTRPAFHKPVPPEAAAETEQPWCNCHACCALDRALERHSWAIGHGRHHLRETRAAVRAAGAAVDEAHGLNEYVYVTGHIDHGLQHVPHLHLQVADEEPPAYNPVSILYEPEEPL